MRLPLPSIRLKFREKKKAAKWARAVIADPNIVYVAIETAISKGDMGIVDLAVLASDGTVLLNAIIDPEMDITYEMSAKHGIEKRNVVNRPRWMEMHRTYSELVAGKRVVVWDMEHVRSAVRFNAKRYNLQLPRYSWEDAMKYYSQSRGNWSPLYKDWRPETIDNACKILRLEAPKHRALERAETCRTIVQKLAEK